MELLLRPGGRARTACPIIIPADGPVPTAFQSGPNLVFVQRDGDGVAAVVNLYDPDADALLAPIGAEPGPGVDLADDGSEIAVRIAGEPFTTYRYRDVPARPFFWPVLAPGGIPVTRAWPMSEEVAGETRDHRHHRSLYFAFGEVNGADNWSEEPGHAYTIHRSVDELVSGPVFGRFVTTSDWTDSGGRRLLIQKATATFWNLRRDDARLFDVDLRLTAADGDVLFGDTKEGGMLTVRVATPMDVPNGGRIENAYGGVNERETWGCAAHWCDYSGIVQGTRVGIGVMDHPTSFRHPTYWHVRDYGLMGANPFALNAYTNGQKEGSFTLQAGAEMAFRYRVVVHLGDAGESDMRGRYLDFVSPPEGRLR